MDKINVLVATRVTAEQLERMRAISPRLEIHGEPGGIAIMDASEVDYKGIDYPEERPDLDVEGLLAKAEVILATRIPAALAERAPNLRWIQFTSAGVDHLWKPFLDSGKITVTSAKGLHAVPMGEFVLGCMLAFAKGIPQMIEQQRAKVWKKFVIHELHGKTVALIGVGEIGSGVARLARGFGMKIVGIRRRADASGLAAEYDRVVAFDDMASAVAEADYVVSSLPATAKTINMIDAGVFAAMKRSAVFVNVGRGRTVDEPALIKALRDGEIRGAALDVYHQEPLPPDSALWEMPNVILSPHMGADTALYMERMTDIICRNLERYAKGEALGNVVDPFERY